MVSSILSVTTAAADRSLLTIGQLRAAIGLSDGSEDGVLRRIEPRSASAITRRCLVRADGATPPTLRMESLLETFRMEGSRFLLVPSDFRDPEALILSRRPVVTLRSVTEDGTVLDPADYELEAAGGMLYRLRDDRRAHWCARKVVLDFDAGWATVPDDLVRAAQRLVKHFYDTDGQEANLRIDYNEGVNRTEFFASPGAALLPPDVDALLGPYKNLSF